MKILLFLTAFFWTSSAVAQVTIGPRVGMSLNDFQTSMGENQVTGSFASKGFNFGLFGRALIDNFVFQPEAYYNSRMVNVTIAGIGGAPSFDANVRVNQLDIPVLFGWAAVNRKRFNMRFVGGPVASLNIKPSASSASLLPKDYQYDDRNIGFQTGMGMDIGNVTLDFRYEGSLSRMGVGLNPRSNSVIGVIGFKLF